MGLLSITSPVKYNLPLLSDYTFLIGESATGKTLLFEKTRLRIKYIHLLDADSRAALNNGCIDFIDSNSTVAEISRVFETRVNNHIVWIDSGDYMFSVPQIPIIFNGSQCTADLRSLISMHKNKRYIIAARHTYGLDSTRVCKYSIVWDNSNNIFEFKREGRQ